MNKFQLIGKEIMLLIIKLLAIAAVIYGIYWFIQQGSVVVDQGKKHGLVGR